jgi:hypothetical protein
MFPQNQAASCNHETSAEQAPTEMRILTAEELREVVGGPVIHNTNADIPVPTGT